MRSLKVCLQEVFTRRMKASLSSSFFLFWFLCCVFGGAMLILGLKDITVVERPCGYNFPLEVQVEVVDTDMVSECKQS